MEPPCEHGGVTARATATRLAQPSLQWSRRVNTAECVLRVDVAARELPLQWSRRVNTAEWLTLVFGEPDDNLLQWSRRVNTAE